MDSILPLSPSIEEELLGFDQHMRRVRGLAPTTCRNRIRVVHGLLCTRFVGQAVELSALQPDDIRQFIAEQLERRNTISHARAIATALRAYLRYRTGCGDQTEVLAGVISSPVQWSLSSLPRSLTDDEVERLLGSFTPRCSLVPTRLCCGSLWARYGIAQWRDRQARAHRYRLVYRHRDTAPDQVGP